MKIKLIITMIMLFSFCLGIAFAQSTAQNVIMGFLSTSCSRSFTSCFKAYNSTNPFPTTSK